ncbi:MAG TPA: NAD(P)/FAD-dependent oxidoreductase [Pseudolabrys sp.]|jgi:monoamine oxidase
MTQSNTEVAIIGGGAAGIAAARRLRAANIDCLVIEARTRLGGRAWTVDDASGFGLDLGCGWLHSANRNPWVAIAQAHGFIIDKAPPPWRKPALQKGFSLAEQHEFSAAMDKFYDDVDAVAIGPDVAAASVLEPGGRWNDLIIAVGTYISGAELTRVSARDFANYQDTGVNWRVVEGYGTAIAASGGGLSVALECPVRRIDHSGKRLKIETAKGDITADQAIVTLPSAVLADMEHLFAPTLPEKTTAARSLPLGLADKLFMSLADAEEFEPGSRLFGASNRSAIASYHLRPFGRPLIEAYFGGSHAAALEAEGEAAFFESAVAELTALFGGDFAHRVKPVRIHPWGIDPFARGSYSYALPGKADCRAALAAPVDDRLFFAGEACSKYDFSTAHGGWFTGTAAADQAIAARADK